MANKGREAGADVGRRSFLRGAAAGTVSAIVATSAPVDEVSARTPDTAPVAKADAISNRRRKSFEVREKAARMARSRARVVHEVNGDEAELPGYIGNFAKGLVHNGLGEVDPSSYESLLAALRSGRPDDFERIQMGIGPRLVNPQAGLAFDLEGADSHHLRIRPAPRLASAEAAGEMAELYWLALLRDVNFADYGQHPLAMAACSDLSHYSDFRGPKNAEVVTPDTLFRGVTAGDLVGPYISQFLLKDVRLGALKFPQRMETVFPAVDYLTDFDSWLTAQSGPARFSPQPKDPVRRYIRNLRDLGQWVHIDQLYQAYLQACLILLDSGCAIDQGLPAARWQVQVGFVEFGAPHIMTLVTEVATRALKAAWFQKWFVHRRIRPEEFGARVHNQLSGLASYPLNPEILESPAVEAIRSRFGTYLLPQAFPEGCPTHPSFAAGHATVAGACVTVLKAFFDESFTIVSPGVPSADGTRLEPYVGPELTVGNELNKLAANVGIGRNGAGVHWRSDYSESIALGEAVAISVLEEQKLCFNEPFTYTLTRFDGTTITI
jgi:hypothetical protein